MLKLAPELTERQRFEKETFERWKDYILPEKPQLPLPPGERYVDVGCGSQLWESLIDKEFWAVDSVPREVKGRFLQECFPYTSLPDGYFDVAFCIDLIAELPFSLYRLAMSELARILQRDGVLVISTELDTKTKGAKELFLGLICTEFEIESCFEKYKNFFTKFFFTDSCQHVVVVAKKRRVIV